MNAPTFLQKLAHVALIVLAMLVSGSADSALMRSLYVGEAVVDTAARVDAQAQLAALDEVLLRLTGQADVRERLKLGAPDLSQLIQSRQVVERTVFGVDGQRSVILKERVEFDAQAIDQRLAEQGIPRWGRERASVLVWVAIEENFEAQWLEDPIIEEAIREFSRVYGLDLIRPLGDALDLSQLSLADVRGGFLDQVSPSLARYGANVGLMVDLRPDAGRWLARAFWRIDGMDGGQGFLSDTPVSALRSTFASLHRIMAERYATDLNDQTLRTTRIRLLGIDDPVQYSEALGYLKSLSTIQSLRLMRATGNTLEFEVTVQGERLADVLALGQTLDVVRSDASGVLELRLQ